MFFALKSYLLFLLKSTNQHGIHSPFVYNLVTRCFYEKSSSASIVMFSAYRNKLLQASFAINVLDFGAGSKVFKSNQREIAKIAKNSGIANKQAQLLTRLTTYFNSNAILEIGTSLGISTSAMHLGNPSSKITTLEGCPETAKIAKQQFKEFQYTSIDLIVGDFNNTLPKTIQHQKYDFIYFDGNHRKTPTLLYFETCLKTIHNDSFFIFDDIHWSKEMEEAWELIKNHSKVTVSIDTYQWGIVFFRKQQEKEHFTIRV